jgi:hypothetical protein
MERRKKRGRRRVSKMADPKPHHEDRSEEYNRAKAQREKATVNLKAM